MEDYNIEINRENAIWLLQDDLDKYLETYVEEGNDRSWGKITIYENWDYHVELLRDGKIPSYSDNPKEWYKYLLALEDYDCLSEWMAYEWLEDQSVDDQLVYFTGEYKDFYEKEYK
tara:strand:+ start:177 stop:524 length:348 start_codon:yes stop_codon:yes gene_type:complete